LQSSQRDTQSKPHVLLIILFVGAGVSGARVSGTGVSGASVALGSKHHVPLHCRQFASLSIQNRRSGALQFSVSVPPVVTAVVLVVVPIGLMEPRAPRHCIMLLKKKRPTAS
jgi:hypothetical protein